MKVQYMKLYKGIKKYVLSKQVNEKILNNLTFTT